MSHPKLSQFARQCLFITILSTPFLAATSHAAQCPLVPKGVAEMEDTERAQLLGEFKFQELENVLAKKHKKNLSSPGGDLLTLRDIVNLQQMSGGGDKLVRMWVDQRPDSFFAQLNAGIYYVNQAFGVRGQGAASTVGSKQVREIEKISQQAQAHLQKAAALDPRSALPQATMIGLAAMLGKVDSRTSEQWLQTANQIDPKNLAARIQAVSYLSPRWGGSFELLDQMATQAEKPLSSEAAHYLKYNVVIAKGSHFEVIERDKAKAQAMYKQAKSMCDNSETARDGIVRTY